MIGFILEGLKSDSVNTAYLVVASVIITEKSAVTRTL